METTIESLNQAIRYERGEKIRVKVHSFEILPPRHYNAKMKKAIRKFQDENGHMGEEETIYI